MARTFTPSGVVNSGISALWMSRYHGARSLSFAARLSHSWKPSMRPPSCSGSSEWITPRPAVIHWTPPFESRPSWPALSRWRMRPAIM
jgi:hypothetical protein